MPSNPRPLTPEPSTIGVIVGRDLVGDALIKLPFLRALRNAWPKAEIHWIASDGPTAFSTVLRQPTRALIDRTYEKPEWLNAHGQEHGSSALRDWCGLFTYTRRPAPAPGAPFFDLLIDTRNRWRDALHARALPHRLFLATALRFAFSEKRPPLAAPRPAHICDRLLNLVELAAGHRPPSSGALPVAEEVMARARQILPEGKIYIGLAPGAGYRIKVWPRFKFEKVGITQARKGRVPVFILGPQELSWYDELKAMVPAALFPLQDYGLWGSHQITLEHTLAIGRLLNVAVANDSGVGHMLAASDCPLISLFGPTSPEKLAPRVTQGMVIKAQTFGSSHMRDITWEAVNDAIETMLALSAGPKI